MTKDKYDFIICGAGPVGLAAAIVAGRRGARTLVLEKGAKPGMDPRGESIINHPLIQELLGKDWLEKNALTSPSTRRFHSPNDRKSTVIDVYEPYYFFDWHNLISHMLKLAKQAGVEFKCNRSVIDLIEEAGCCRGVITGSAKVGKNKSETYFGNTVLNCMGHSDPFSKRFDIEREEIDCPTIKYLSRKAPAVRIKDHPDLQFYIIPPGVLKSYPQLPPAVAYVFPLKDGMMEGGLMLRMSSVRYHKNLEIPNKDKMLRIWDDITKTYPGFSDFFKDSKPSYQKLTMISNRKMVEDIIPHKNGGLILLGDTVGFSEANGSSGLFFGMAQAYFWVNLILDKKEGDKVKKNSVKNHISNGDADIWSADSVQLWMNEYREWDIYKYVRKSYHDITLAERIMFKTLGTDKRLNRMWGIMMKTFQAMTGNVSQITRNYNSNR